MFSPPSLFVALGRSPLGHYMQTSQWAFAIVEMVHLLAIATLGGSVLFVDLRLLGVVLKGQSAPIIARDLGRVLLASLVVLLVSGVALLSEEATKCYLSPAFRWKMALLVSAVAFYFSLHRRAINQLGLGAPSLKIKTIGATSLALWLGVGVAGRAIGLL